MFVWRVLRVCVLLLFEFVLFVLRLCFFLVCVFDAGFVLIVALFVVVCLCA